MKTLNKTACCSPAFVDAKKALPALPIVGTPMQMGPSAGQPGGKSAQ